MADQEEHPDSAPGQAPEDDPLAIVPERADLPPPARPRLRDRLRALLPRRRRPRPSRDYDPLLRAGLVCATILFGAFLVFAPRWWNGLSVYRGIIQEQYFLLGQYAFDRLIEEELRAGYFPLWNHLNALGTPLLGNMLSAALYPLKLIIYWRDTDLVRDLYIVLRLLIAGGFAFALGRRLRLSTGAALFTAVLFAFTGYFKQFANENYLNADVLLPGAVWLTLRLRHRPARLDLLALAVLIFAILQNGHPEAAFYTLLLPVALVAASGRQGLREAAPPLLAAAALGFILSLPMLLPFLEYWARGYHFHAPYAGFFHYAARELPALVSPWFYHPAAPGAPFYHPAAIGWPDTVGGLPGYAQTVVPWLAPALGAPALFFALVAVVDLRRLPRVQLAVLAYCLFFTGVMFGLPGFRLLGFLPVFDFSGNFKHPLPGVALGVALLAGRGLELSIRHRVTGSRVFASFVAFFLAVLCLGVMQEDVSNYLNQRTLAELLAVLAVAGWAAYVAARAETQSLAEIAFRQVTCAAAVVVALFCLALDGWHQPAREADYLSRVSPAARAKLTAQAGLDRVYFSQELFPPNLNILLGMPDLRVMDGINDRRLVELVNRINGHTRGEGGRYWYREVGYLQPMPDRLGHPLLRLLNVRFAALDGPLPYNRALFDLISGSDSLAPAPGYVGRARLPLGAGLAPGLLLHPPARLDLPPAPGDTASVFCRFTPSFTAAAVAGEPDGVWLLALREGRLEHARYAHPRGMPGETRLPGLEIGLRPGARLSLASLPAASTVYDQFGLADLRLGQPEDFSAGSWEEVTRIGTWLYRDPEAMPRFFAVGRAEARPEAQALEELATGAADFRTVALISDGASAGGAAETRRNRLAGQVKSISYRSQRVEAEMEMAAAGWLVISDLWYPGWRAWVDGAEQRVRRADYCLRALPLPAGPHRVEMVYRPWSFRVGLWLSLVSAAGLVAGALARPRAEIPALDRVAPAVEARPDEGTTEIFAPVSTAGSSGDDGAGGGGVPEGK